MAIFSPISWLSFALDAEHEGLPATLKPLRVVSTAQRRTWPDLETCFTISVSAMFDSRSVSDTRGAVRPLSSTACSMAWSFIVHFQGCGGCSPVPPNRALKRTATPPLSCLLGNTAHAPAAPQWSSLLRANHVVHISARGLPEQTGSPPFVCR